RHRHGGGSALPQRRTSVRAASSGESSMIVEALRKIVEGEHLTEQEAGQVATAIIEGQATHAQIGAVLASLRTKRESVDELTGFARVMREHSIKVTATRRPLIDTCG